MKNFWFQMSISLIKSLTYKIKKHKNFYNFLTGTDRGNWKKIIKNNKKIKKQMLKFFDKISNP